MSNRPIMTGALAVDDEHENNVQLSGPADVDPEQLSSFLTEAFGPVKGGFLMHHGDWWHRSPGGRLIATLDGVIAGYRGFTSTTVLVGGREVPAIWAMDLYVSPRFRGKGLQRVLDDRLVHEAPLRMSFPNVTGAKIYVKQGYGLREDLRVLHLPLHPRLLPALGLERGLRKRLLRAGALGVSPLAAVFREYIRRYQPKRTEVVTAPQTAALEHLFRRHAAALAVTTVRSAEFLRWRYFDAPYREDLAFYQTSLHGRPTHYAIVRRLVSGGAMKDRVLDLVGDLTDSEGLRDLFHTIARDSTARGSAQVMTLASAPGILSAARSAGFILSTGLRFRWSADDPAVHRELGLAAPYWTLADGEIDPPS